MIRRRDFLRNTLVGGSALLAARCIPDALAFDSCHIEFAHRDSP